METIEDILREMRETSDWCHNNQLSKTWEDWEKMHRLLIGFADRVEAAHKNDTDQVVHLLTNSVEQEKRIENLRLEYVEQRKKIQQLEQENARLKSALKPVLECDTDGITLNFEEVELETFEKNEVKSAFATLKAMEAAINTRNYFSALGLIGSLAIRMSEAESFRKMSEKIAANGKAAVHCMNILNEAKSIYNEKEESK